MMARKALLILSVKLFSLTALSHGNAIEVDILDGLPNQAAVPAELTIGVFTDEGEPITEFRKDHAKYMHLMAISADRQHFAHLHPSWLGNPQEGSHRFRLRVNTQTNEFDNFQSSQVFPVRGDYILYTEVFPKDFTEVAKASFDFTIDSGPDDPTTLVNDVPLSDGTFTKYFRRDSMGTASVLAATAEAYDYRVTLKVSVLAVGHHRTVQFDYQVFVNELGLERVIKHKNLLNWMSMKGHAAIVSENHDDMFHLHYPHMSHDHGGHHKMQMQVNPEAETFSFKLELSHRDFNLLSQKELSIWSQFRVGDHTGAEDIDHLGQRNSTMPKSRVLTTPFHLDLSSLLGK